MTLNRRQFLTRALLGAGNIGLLSLATGLPLSFFRGSWPSAEALAEPTERPQFLLMFTSSAGDPFNANAPGCYGVSGVVQNPDPSMAETALRLGSVSTSAAAPWATLPQRVLDRTCFIHHRTYQNTHPQYNKVMGLVGSARTIAGNGNEHMVSVFSSENTQALDTIQREPLSLGRNAVQFDGKILQSLKPRTLSRLFEAPGDDRELQLTQLRADALDNISRHFKQNGTPAHIDWLDRVATSRDQVAQLDASLIDRFDRITSDSPEAQIDAAIALFLMRVAPVITIHIPFGGDSHNDTGLIQERDETVAGLATLNYLFSELESAGLTDQVTVANLNVFGRTLSKKGTEGRDHNLNHHVMMISGAHVSPGVFGGLEPVGNDFGATPINSATGQGSDGGDIPREETLESAAKTLARTIGVPQSRIEERIQGGKIIQAAIAG